MQTLIDKYRNIKKAKDVFERLSLIDDVAGFSIQRITIEFAHINKAKEVVEIDDVTASMLSLALDLELNRIINKLDQHEVTADENQ